MSTNYTPAQRKAYGIKMAKMRAGNSTKKKNYSKSKSITGYGAYRKGYGKDLGALIGEGIQEGLSQLLGNAEGAVTAGKLISGFGDYHPHNISVKSNVLAEGNSPPVIKNGTDASFIMRHTEYIKDIVATSADFNYDRLVINPGNQELFPWLAPIAQQFEQYRVEGMIFEFRSNFGEVSTSGPLGTIVMATEYNANDLPFPNKLIMENHQYSSSCKPSHSMIHPIECARNKTPVDELYVRTSQESSGDADKRLSDLGIFQIANQGIPSGSYPVPIGELFVHYQIRLIKPKMAGLGNIVQSSYYANTSGIATATPLGTISTMTRSIDNTLAMDIASNGTVTFPDNVGPGLYYVTLWWSWSVLTATTQPTLSNYVNCSTDAANDPFGAGFQAPLIGETATKKFRTWVVRIPSTSTGLSSFQISGGTLPASSNAVVFFISSMDNIGSTQIPYSPALYLHEKDPLNDTNKLIEDYLNTTPTSDGLAKFIDMIRKREKST